MAHFVSGEVTSDLYIKTAGICRVKNENCATNLNFPPRPIHQLLDLMDGNN